MESPIYTLRLLSLSHRITGKDKYRALKSILFGQVPMERLFSEVSPTKTLILSENWHS